MQVEDHAAGLGTGDCDEDHWDSTELPRTRVNVGRERMAGQHLLEQMALGDDVAAEVEGGVAQHLLDGLTLFSAHDGLLWGTR